MKLPPRIAQAVRERGAVIVPGKKHRKIVADGILIGVLPRGSSLGRAPGGSRALRNTVAQIKRTMIRQLDGSR